MSHLSKVKTKLKNMDTLQKVLQEMQCELVMGDNLQLNASYISGTEVDMIVRDKNAKQDYMGFNRNGEELELVGDSYGQGRNMHRFQKDLTKNYAKAEVINQFNLDPELSQFSIVEETTNDKGEQIIKFQRWE